MKNIKYSKFFRLFGIILFIYILSNINIFDLVIILKDINIVYYLIGILFFIFGFLIRILRWKLLVDSIGVEVSFNKLAEMSAKGLFFGLATPAKMGEFWRAKYLTEQSKISGGQAFYTAFADRIIDLLVIMVISLIGFIIISLKFIKIWDWQVPALILFFLPILIYFLSRQKRIKKILNFLIKFLIPDSFKERAGYFLNEFYQAFYGLKLKLFLKVLFLGFIYYVSSGVIFAYLIALALGIIIPFWYLFLIIALVWLIITIPVSVFGLGTREASYIYFFSFFGISASLAVTFSLLALFCNILIIGLPGAILFLKQK